jgi:hypothetical protein
VTWSFGSGQPGHTLTGHGGGVVAVAASALDAAVAVSAGEDRCIKVGAGLEGGFGEGVQVQAGAGARTRGLETREAVGNYGGRVA